MSGLPPEARLWDLMKGALAARALGLVADLGVPRLLEQGPRRVDELARETGADADTLRRVLRALASDGVFEEVGRGAFGHTDVSRLLLGDGWAEFAHFFGGPWHRAAGELGADGEATFGRVHGSDMWAWLAERPSERAAFDRAMVEGTERRAERLDGIGWRGDETVVDVGGGNGALLKALLARRPGLRGVVFDLPETTVDEASLPEGCTFVAGSFFERVPAGDVFVLSTILHDWDDERAAAILRTIRAAAAPGARLVALETVVPDGNEQHGGKWLDLLMLALFAGRERDEAQWRALLTGTGWEPESVADGLVVARCR